MDPLLCFVFFLFIFSNNSFTKDCDTLVVLRICGVHIANQMHSNRTVNSTGGRSDIDPFLDFRGPLRGREGTEGRERRREGSPDVSGEGLLMLSPVLLQTFASFLTYQHRLSIVYMF